MLFVVVFATVFNVEGDDNFEVLPEKRRTVEETINDP